MHFNQLPKPSRWLSFRLWLAMLIAPELAQLVARLREPDYSGGVPPMRRL